jgi:hypothetical protein
LINQCLGPSTGTFDGLAFEVNKTRSVTRGQFSTISFKEIFANAPVFLADIQSGGGSPINVRRDQKDLIGVDVKIDDAPDLNADGAKPQNTDVVGYILIRYVTRCQAQAQTACEPARQGVRLGVSGGSG